MSDLIRPKGEKLRNRNTLGLGCELSVASSSYANKLEVDHLPVSLSLSLSKNCNQSWAMFYQTMPVKAQTNAMRDRYACHMYLYSRCHIRVSVRRLLLPPMSGGDLWCSMVIDRIDCTYHVPLPIPRTQKSQLPLPKPAFLPL